MLAVSMGIAAALALLFSVVPLGAQAAPERARVPQPATPLVVRDPIDVPGIILGGKSISNSFGSSIATAGDINADGYDDLLVGAYGYDANTGRAYLYYGSAEGYTHTLKLELPGETADNYFGRSLVATRDVSGDGFADVAIGAYGYLDFTGRVYLYQGGAQGLASTPMLTLTHGTAGEGFGRSLAAGDLNGDSYPDLVVGAPHYSAETGRSYVYYGQPYGLDAAPGLTLTGPISGSWFGLAVTAGDVNGDGVDDLVIGSPQGSDESSKPVQAGHVYVYHGSSGGLDALPALNLSGPEPGALFGISVAMVGDANEDGYADIVVGAPGTAAHTGQAFVYYGSDAGLSATPVLTLTGEGLKSAFGRSAASAGDVNGDGHSDLVIGAHGYPGGTGPGRAYLYFGSSAGLDATPILTLTGTSDYEHFGHSAVPAGDIDGDGYADFAIGGQAYLSGTGRVYVYNLGQQVRLASSTYSVGEAAGSARLAVRLLAPAAEVISVTVRTDNGTASSADYTPISTTVVLEKGAISVAAAIAIANDGLIEPDETVLLTLSAPVNALLGVPNTAVLTIVDDDTPPAALNRLYLPHIGR